jgi:hypothetical protein
MSCGQPKTNINRGISFVALDVPNVTSQQAWFILGLNWRAATRSSCTQKLNCAVFSFCLQGRNQRKQSCELNILIFHIRLQKLNVYKSRKQPNLCSFYEEHLRRLEEHKPAVEQPGAAATLYTSQLGSSPTSLFVYCLAIRPGVDEIQRTCMKAVGYPTVNTIPAFFRRDCIKTRSSQVRTAGLLIETNNRKFPNTNQQHCQEPEVTNLKLRSIRWRKQRHTSRHRYVAIWHATLIYLLDGSRWIHAPLYTGGYYNRVERNRAWL